MIRARFAPPRVPASTICLYRVAAKSYD